MQEEQAFEKLFKSNYKRFVSVALAYTKQREVAEEVVQDVFVDFWKRIQNDEQILNHEAYLRKAIVYRSLDVIKKEKKHIEKEDVSIMDNLISTSDQNPESKLIGEEKVQYLQKQIESLPEKTKHIFMLSRFEKMSYKEISEHIDIKEKTVEYHIMKALSSLRKALFIGILALIHIIF
jgi:RNA polymerase sigma-70 factor (ECF subfamily)